MRALVREAVEAYLPRGALEVCRVAEASECEGLRTLADLIPERVADVTEVLAA